MEHGMRVNAGHAWLEGSLALEMLVGPMTDGWSDQDLKVLNAFLDRETLVRIPAKRKKRDVILRWLQQQFEPGILYPEAEVNRILRRHHPDCATLRRELFESGYLHRQGGGGSYWRTEDLSSGE